MNFVMINFFIAVLLIISGAFYKKLQKKSIIEPFLALSLGVLVGPNIPEQRSSLGNEFAKIKKLNRKTSSEKR